MASINPNLLRIVDVLDIIKESPTVKALFFHDELCRKAEPGQFLMIWIPGVDEVPMSLSSIDDNGICSISVGKIGDATKAIHKLQKSDCFGIRGPFGRGFSIQKCKALIVGGGTGLAPLIALANKLIKIKASITFLIGAKTKNELLFLDKINNTSRKIIVMAATEDGSYGYTGVVTDLAKEILQTSRFDMLYSCGPELMMNEMFMLAEKNDVPIEVSLERFMRCAMGLCGSCVINKYLVCRDGPIFSSEQLREMKNEFGKFKRDFDGSQMPV